MKDTKGVTRQRIDYNRRPENQMQKPQRAETDPDPEEKKQHMRKTWQKAG